MWRLLCACLIDIMWVGWTRWAHQGVVPDSRTQLEEWRVSVHDQITTLWVRANRRVREYDTHVDYVPGCVWSRPREDHVGMFKNTWEGVLGRVVGCRWNTRFDTL